MLKEHDEAGLFSSGKLKSLKEDYSYDKRLYTFTASHVHAKNRQDILLSEKRQSHPTKSDPPLAEDAPSAVEPFVLLPLPVQRNPHPFRHKLSALKN